MKLGFNVQLFSLVDAYSLHAAAGPGLYVVRSHTTTTHRDALLVVD